MARPGISEAHRQAAAVQAARRMIARRERPGYRLVAVQDGLWAVDGSLGVAVSADTRKAALTAARTDIADVLGVDPESFDLE